MNEDPPAAPDRLDAWLEQRLGSPIDANAAGILHVCSCWRDPQGVLRAIRIGADAPSGPTDAFVLRAARAQADVIVTSARIVRHEPELDHTLGKGPLGSLLRAYRARVLRRTTPPRTLVVSHSGDLPAQHPLWDDWTQVTVWTPEAHVRGLRVRLPAHIDVVAASGEGLEPAFDHLRAQGARRISLEVGPRAMAGVYSANLVDELWCARYLEAGLALGAQGAAWPFDDGDLARWARGAPSETNEPSGRWRFARYEPERA